MYLIAVNSYDDHGLRDKVIQYIESHPKYEEDTPYFCYRSGKSYTLKDVRNKVDGELDKMIRNLLFLTFDLLTRGELTL